ncbi:MAG TPA: multicopper oxidase domain-containing protein, partial [Gemmatimonadaceae bacterium]|nr:multicopper oxidase domain-containing protein [Gemmatimonadaceae bacterium]
MQNITASPVARPDRRAFLKTSALTAVVGGLLAACGKGSSGTAAVASKPTADSDQSGGAMAAHPTVPSAMAAADEMDRMHEAGIKAFPAKTAGLGNQVLAPKLVGGVKVFELTASKIQWETSPGLKVDAFAYNEQVPGPQIHVTEGDRVRVILKNNLPESTAIHFHGLELVNAMDGVPFITQPPVKPGQSFTYE